MAGGNAYQISGNLSFEQSATGTLICEHGVVISPTVSLDLEGLVTIADGLTINDRLIQAA